MGRRRRVEVGTEEVKPEIVRGTNVEVQGNAALSVIAPGVVRLQLDHGDGFSAPPGAYIHDTGRGTMIVIECRSTFPDSVAADVLRRLSAPCGDQEHGLLMPHEAGICGAPWSTLADSARRSVEERAVTRFRAGIREILIGYGCGCSLTFDHPYVGSDLVWCKEHHGRADRIEIRGMA